MSHRLYSEILIATKNLHGWCEPGKQIALANLVLAVRPTRIVEIGVWGGKSLIPMALAARHLATNTIAHVVAIDPWKASESIQGQEAKDCEWWDNQAQHDLVYSDFCVNLNRLMLGFVEVLRKSSEDVPRFPYIHLLHIDGNHGPQAVKDVQRFCPSIPSGGICVLDDLNWTGGAVGQAAEWLKQNGFMELHPLGTGAVYLKL